MAKAHENRGGISQNDNNIRGEDTSLMQALWSNMWDIEGTGVKTAQSCGNVCGVTGVYQGMAAT